MTGTVHKLRRLKHADPEKFKVLAEDLEPRRSWPMWSAALLCVSLGLGYFADDLLDGRWLAAMPGSGCAIKGNISDDNQRIYHLPGQDYYRRTRIDLVRGERWFCSESEARAAGWRRSRI
ncbi:hypothetical protein [Nitratireductor pacificus]|uniref:Nuclease n=1 Tax=Nitratireductor pacificus pht-3B TaxID=391937 RepID=K2M7T4_9HYPH|nr:hypothetical protein [Nitratireductor pacificus]EKF17050.1 hypothetical protein NA2_19808 [Nitratireductor pacificus pht-3B]